MKFAKVSKKDKNDRIATLEAELKATQRELAKVKEELARKEYDEFYEDSYRLYMRKFGEALTEIDELKKENNTLKGALKSLEAFAEALRHKRGNTEEMTA